MWDNFIVYCIYCSYCIYSFLCWKEGSQACQWDQFLVQTFDQFRDGTGRGSLEIPKIAKYKWRNHPKLTLWVFKKIHTLKKNVIRKVICKSTNKTQSQISNLLSVLNFRLYCVRSFIHKYCDKSFINKPAFLNFVPQLIRKIYRAGKKGDFTDLHTR